MTNARPNTAQEEFWTTGPGVFFAEQNDTLDILFEAALTALFEAADLKSGQSVLDIGCGGGATSFRAAELVGPRGEVTGLDISDTLLEVARRNAVTRGLERVTFELGDAQVATLPAAHYDRVVSRYGVMFFEDPVAAMRNLARALKPKGTMTFITWAPLRFNPWFFIPTVAATARLGPVPPPPPHSPGPFGFADATYVLDLFERAGLADASVETIDVRFRYPGGKDEPTRIACLSGAVATFMREGNGTEEDRAAIRDAVAMGFGQFDGPYGLSLPARLHIYRARSG